MPTADQSIRVYTELATLCDRQGQPQMHDRFLVLAADAALTAGRADEAERLRQRLLQHNPHHLLKPYASFVEAMGAPDVQSYVTALRRSHPHDAAEQLLQTLRKDAGEPMYTDEPPEQATAVGPGDDWGLDLKADEPADGLKVFRAPEPAEEPDLMPLPETLVPGSQRPNPAALEPTKPKGLNPWQASPPPPTRVTKKTTEEERKAPERAGPAQPVPRKPRATVLPPAPAAIPLPPTAQAPKPMAQPRPPAAPVRPAPVREVYKPKPEPLPARRPPLVDHDEADSGAAALLGSYWVGSILFGVLLVLSLALTVYTLAGPLLAHHSLP
jgi:hypothetical protein